MNLWMTSEPLLFINTNLYGSDTTPRSTKGAIDAMMMTSRSFNKILLLQHQ